MNIEICKKCKMYPEYFIKQHDLDNKKNIHYFYGYNKKYFEECDAWPCIIIEKSSKNYSRDDFSVDEIFSHKNIKPDKRSCPYYLEHQISDWNKKK